MLIFFFTKLVRKTIGRFKYTYAYMYNVYNREHIPEVANSTQSASVEIVVLLQSLHFEIIHFRPHFSSVSFITFRHHRCTTFDELHPRRLTPAFAVD